MIHQTPASPHYLSTDFLSSLWHNISLSHCIDQRRMTSEAEVYCTWVQPTPISTSYTILGVPKRWPANSYRVNSCKWSFIYYTALYEDDAFILWALNSILEEGSSLNVSVSPMRAILKPTSCLESFPPISQIPKWRKHNQSQEGKPSKFLDALEERLYQHSRCCGNHCLGDPHYSMPPLQPNPTSDLHLVEEFTSPTVVS